MVRFVYDTRHLIPASPKLLNDSLNIYIHEGALCAAKFSWFLQTHLVHYLVVSAAVLLTSAPADVLKGVMAMCRRSHSKSHSNRVKKRDIAIVFQRKAQRITSYIKKMWVVSTLTRCWNRVLIPAVLARCSDKVSLGYRPDVTVVTQGLDSAVWVQKQWQSTQKRVATWDWLTVTQITRDQCRIQRPTY